MTNLTDRLAAIRARVERATLGPWFTEERDLDNPHNLTAVYNVFHNVFHNDDTPDRDLVADVAYDNAEFIAHARTDVPALLAAVESMLELHKSDRTDVLTGSCATEDCEHAELDDCETAEFVYCLACNELAEEVNPYYAERGMSPVAHPCPTVQTITTALEVKG